MIPELEPATRARLRTTLRVVMVLVLVWLLATGGLIFVARQQVSSGLDQLQGARDRLSADALLRGQGLGALQQAERDFADAHSLATNPVLAPWSIIPLAGSNVGAVRALTAGAEHVAAVGARAARDGSAALRSHPTTGPERLAVLDRVAAVAARASSDLEHVSLGPDFFLIGPLGDARARFLDRLRRLREAVANAQALATGAAQVLRGPRHYLVLAANNGEMRAGSGMFLSSGVASFAGGTFSIGAMGPSADRDLPPGAVPVPPTLASLWGWLAPSQHWRNLASTPRFDVTAPLAAQMWEAATGEHVDGVLAVDAVALQALLAAQGPVNVAGQQLTGADALSYLLLGQYAGVQSSGANADRRDQLSAIARASIDTLSSRPWNAQALVSDLSGVGKGRHILAWSRDPVEERAWEGAGIAGELHADSLAVSVMNFGGNKLDQFLQVDAALSVQTQSGGGSDARLDLRLHNAAPPGVAGYVAGSGTAEGVYQGVLAVNVPGAASLPVLHGITPTLALGLDGPTKVTAAGYFQIPRGQTLRVTVQFQLPSGVSEMSVEPSARVPPVAWSFRSLKFTDTAVEHLAW